MKDRLWVVTAITALSFVVALHILASTTTAGTGEAGAAVVVVQINNNNNNINSNSNGNSNQPSRIVVVRQNQPQEQPALENGGQTQVGGNQPAPTAPPARPSSLVSLDDIPRPACPLPPLVADPSPQLGVNTGGPCRPVMKCHNFARHLVRLCAANAFVETSSTKDTQRIRIVGVVNNMIQLPRGNAKLLAMIPRRPAIAVNFVMRSKFACIVNGVRYPVTVSQGSFVVFFVCDIPTRDWIDGDTIEMDELLTGGLHMQIPVCVPPPVTGSKQDDLVVCVAPLHGPIEPRLILEWLAYQKALGVSHVYMYDRFARYGRMLQSAIEEGLMSLIHFAPFNMDYACLLDNTFDQQFALNHCLHMTRARGHSYAAFMDVDEYLVHPPAPQNSSQFLLSFLKKELEPAHRMGVHLDMVAIGGHPVVANPQALLVERYQKRPIEVPLPMSNPKFIVACKRVLQVEVHSILHDSWQNLPAFKRIGLWNGEVRKANSTTELRFQHFHHTVLDLDPAAFRNVGPLRSYNVTDNAAAWAVIQQTEIMKRWNALVAALSGDTS